MYIMLCNILILKYCKKYQVVPVHVAAAGPDGAGVGGRDRHDPRRHVPPLEGPQHVPARPLTRPPSGRSQHVPDTSPLVPRTQPAAPPWPCGDDRARGVPCHAPVTSLPRPCHVPATSPATSPPHPPNWGRAVHKAGTRAPSPFDRPLQLRAFPRMGGRAPEAQARPPGID